MNIYPKLCLCPASSLIQSTHQGQAALIQTALLTPDLPFQRKADGASGGSLEGPCHLQRLLNQLLAS